ncbi:MAG: hypothetical protein ACXVWU_11150 [Nocardioides sp.]
MPTGPQPRTQAQAGPFIGVGGLVVAAFLYGYSALALPSWLHSLVMPLLWLVLFVLATRWFSTRPTAVMLLPVLALAAWVGLLLGPRLLAG